MSTGENPASYPVHHLCEDDARSSGEPISESGWLLRNTESLERSRFSHKLDVDFEKCALEFSRDDYVIRLPLTPSA